MPELLTLEEGKLLLGLCRAGKLYEIEKWIASGKSLRTPREVKKTPLQIALDLEFHSLVELLVRNEDSQGRKTRLFGKWFRNGGWISCNCSSTMVPKPDPSRFPMYC